MNPIENKALQTYQTNLKYLSSNFPELFKEVALLDGLIQTGQYLEKYALEYKEGYFDILDIKENKFLYGKNSDRISKKIAQASNSKKNESVIETFYEGYANLSQEVAQNINDNIKLHENALMATSNIVYYTTHMAPKNTTTILHIFKYIFFGVGTGKHLELIQRKFRFKQVLIVENSIELFRLSLFTLNYEKVFDGVKVFFSIAENEHKFAESFTKYLRKGFSHNHFLKYSLFSPEYLKQIKSIQNELVLADHIAFPYSKRLVITLKAPYYLVHKYNFFNVSKRLYKTVFSSKPVIIVAAGPSLRNNIEWLKENKDHFIVVSLLASLKTLHEHDIKPDVLINLDSQSIMTKFFSGIDIDTYLSKTIFLFASMTHKHVSDMLPKENIYFFDNSQSYKKGFGKISSPSVGELAYSFMLSFDAKDIYLLGLDLALDPDTKQRYADADHSSNITQETQDIHNTQLEGTIIEVEGNFLDTVPTLPIFKMSIDTFAAISDKVKEADQSVFNLNNGAKLEGSTPLKIKDIDMKKIPSFKKDEQYIKELKDFFDNNSENMANQDDIDLFEGFIKGARKLLDILNEYKEKEIYDIIDDNMISFAKLIDSLQTIDINDTKDINVLYTIMLKYNQFITSYIIAFFNTNEIKDPVKHFKYIYETYLQQSEKIIAIYLDIMEKYKLIAEHELHESEKKYSRSKITS